MEKEKSVTFDNEIVKQGNSYCVRIPKGALEYLGFGLGDTVNVKISKPKKERLPKGILDIYRKNIKELRSFRDKDLNDCFFIFSAELNATKNLTKKEKKASVCAFEKMIELQKGKDFLKKYFTFKKIIIIPNTKKIIRSLRKSKYSEIANVIDMQVNKTVLSV